MTHRFQSWVEGRGPKPSFTMEYHWFLGHEMLPAGVGPNEYWVAEIEGTPSARMVIDLRASLDNNDRFYEIGNLRTEPGYHAMPTAPDLRVKTYLLLTSLVRELRSRTQDSLS